MVFKFHQINVDFKGETVESEEGRWYETPIGLLASITTVLGTKKSPGLQDWIDRVGEEEANKSKNRGAARGNILHDQIEEYLRTGRYPSDSLAAQLVPKLDKNLELIHALEIPLWSKRLRIAGRCDCVGIWKGKLSIIDFKTTTRAKNKEWIQSYFEQATAYALMLYELTGIKIEQIVILLSGEDASAVVYEELPKNYIKSLMETVSEYHSKLNTS